MLAMRPAAAAFSETPAALLDKFDSGGGAVHSRDGAIPGYGFSWKLNTADSRITVAISAPTTGWVGLGFGEAAAMKGADILIGSVDDTTGEATAGDYHVGDANARPTLDGCQDWTLHHGEQDAATSSTLIVASRAFTTQDSNDRPIITTGLRTAAILMAYGSGDGASFSMHSTANRVKVMIDLSTGGGAQKADFIERLAAIPSYSYIDLFFNNATAPTAGDSMFRTPFSGGREILPADSRTAYWEYCFPLSAHPEWSAHNGKSLVAFNGILDTGATRPDLVHHSVLYAYSGDDCSGTDSIIWVGGVNFYEELPSDVGMSFSRFQSFRIQVHYDNPNLEAGLKDNSGIRIWLDASARQHEAGTLQLGDPRVSLSRNGGHQIQPGKSFWEFKCPSSVTQNWHEITVFSQILHMHQIGDAMYLEVKDSSGVVKRPNAVEYFDFAWQDPTLVQPFKIKPGDELITRCYFNNKGSTPVSFGLGSDEEMCIDFIFYYPYLESNNALAPTQYCGFEAFGSFEQKQVVDDDGFRVFAVDAGTPDDPKCANEESGDKTENANEESGEESGASAMTTTPSILFAAVFSAVWSAWA